MAGGARQQQFESMRGGFEGRGGMAGGGPGATGRNFVIRVDGTETPLGPFDRTEMAAGDIFVIETPGGGGYGVP